MTEREILRSIDKGANHYIALFGKAAHMDTVRREFYSYIKPNSDEHGIRFVYDLRIESLPHQRPRAVIAEIKALNMPVWVDLLSSDVLFEDLFGRKKAHGQTEFTENDEVYLAMLPGETFKSTVKKKYNKGQLPGGICRMGKNSQRRSVRRQARHAPRSPLSPVPRWSH